MEVEDVVSQETEKPGAGGGNSVDVSGDVIDAEWERIAREHETGPIPKVSEGESGSVTFEHQAPAAPGVAREDKIKMASIVILGGLKFAFGAIGGLDIDDSKYKALADAYGAVIVKHFDGGIFEFLAKYKEELAAVGATIAFIGAVRSGIIQKKAKEDDQKLAGVAGGNSEKK